MKKTVIAPGNIGLIIDRLRKFLRLKQRYFKNYENLRVGEFNRINSLPDDKLTCVDPKIGRSDNWDCLGNKANIIMALQINNTDLRALLLLEGDVIYFKPHKIVIRKVAKLKLPKDAECISAYRQFETIIIV